MKGPPWTRADSCGEREEKESEGGEKEEEEEEEEENEKEGRARKEKETRGIGEVKADRYSRTDQVAEARAVASALGPGTLPGRQP